MKIPGRTGQSPSSPSPGQPPQAPSRSLPRAIGETNAVSPQAASAALPRLPRPSQQAPASSVTQPAQPAVTVSPEKGGSSRLLLFALLALLLLGAAGTGWGTLKYSRTKAAFEQQVAELEQNLGQTRRRQAEEQARADQAQRLNSDLKGQLADLQSDFDALLATKQASSSQSQKQIVLLQKQLGEWQQQAENQKAKNLQLQTKNDEQLAEIRKLQKESNQLTAQNNSLEKKLDYSNRKIDRLIGHNVALSKAAADLLDAYENKGVFSALVAKEPLTGMGKIKIEHLIQDYRQQVSQNTVEDTR